MSELPASWVATTLGQVVSYADNETADPADMPPEAWLLELEDIERDTGKVLERKTVGERAPKSSKNRFQAGDVLYGKLRPYLNKVIRAKQDGFCSSEIIAISPGLLDKNYLFYSMRSPSFIEYVSSVSHGMRMPRLGTQQAKSAPFVLPPLAEQTRIAATLDELVAQVDTLKARIDGIPALLKRFRQSVLAAAVSGRLTEEWRGGAEVDWSFQRAVDVCEKVQSGGTPKDGFSESGVPFLKVYNIVNQKIDFEYRPQYISETVNRGASSKSITLPGDVVMNIVGPPLGKVATIPAASPEWNINQAITLFRPSTSVVSGWISIVLLGGENLRSIINETKGSAGQVNISLSQCRNFLFPVPSIEEQIEIVRRVEQLFAFADQLEAKVTSAKSRIDHLTQSMDSRVPEAATPN